MSGDNPLTEKEVDQGGPSSGKLNEIDDKRVTNTNSIKDEPKAPGGNALKIPSVLKFTAAMFYFAV